MSKLSRFLTAAVVSAGLLWARPAPAQQIVASIKSVDELTASLKYLLGMIGQEAAANQFEQIKMVLAGGVDTTKPITGFLDLPANPGSAPVFVAVLPITTEDGLLGVLRVLRAEPTKGNDGIYDIAAADGKRYAMKFANGHAYISTDRLRLTAALPAPAALIPSEAGAAVMAVAVRIGEISNAYKDLARNLIDAGIEQGRSRNAGENEVQYRLRQLLSAGAKERIGRLLDDGKDLTVRLEVDRAQQRQMAWEVSLTAKSGSRLADEIRLFADSRSIFSGLASDAAASLLVRIPLSEEIRKFSSDAYAGIVKEALDKVAEPTANALLERLFKGIAASAATDAADLAGALRGPFADGKFAFVAAANLGDGAKLEEAVRSILGDTNLQSVAEIALDADKVGGTAIHRVRVGQEPDAGFKRFFGRVEFYIAVRKDAVVFALGENGKTAIREALEVAGKPAPLIAPSVQLEASLAKILPVLAADKADRAAAVVGRTFAGVDKIRDKIRFSVRGGDALRIRAEMHALVIKAFAELNKAE